MPSVRCWIQTAHMQQQSNFDTCSQILNITSHTRTRTHRLLAITIYADMESWVIIQQPTWEMQYWEEAKQNWHAHNFASRFKFLVVFSPFTHPSSRFQLEPNNRARSRVEGWKRETNTEGGRHTKKNRRWRERKAQKKMCKEKSLICVCTPVLCVYIYSVHSVHAHICVCADCMSTSQGHCWELGGRGKN